MHDEAVRWLTALRGEFMIERNSKGHPMAVVVRVERALGGVVSRRADVLPGFSDELAERQAFTRACDELRRALM